MQPSDAILNPLSNVANNECSIQAQEDIVNNECSIQAQEDIVNNDVKLQKELHAAAEKSATEHRLQAFKNENTGPGSRKVVNQIHCI